MKYSPLLFACVLIVLSCRNDETTSKNGSFVLEIDSIVNDAPDFSGVVLIADNGRSVYHKAFGYRDFRTKDKLDTLSVFELASVSKQFTAMIIMILEAEKKLQYDEPIEKYISGLPYNGITIRHLLNHTSGLPDYQSIMEEHWDKSKVAGNDDNIAYLIKYHPPVNFQPGHRYQYSNTGYMLLASIAEKASGKDFIKLCRDKIFEPVEMNDTDIRTRDQKNQMPRIAWGHLFVDERNEYVHADSFPQFNYAIWLGNRKGPGRISSTSTDLLKWDRALQSEKLLKQEELEEAFQPVRLKNDSVSNYGFGWTLMSLSDGDRIVGHSGDNPGYKTFIIRYLDKKRTLIVLCNNAHRDFDKIVRALDTLVRSTESFH